MNRKLRDSVIAVTLLSLGAWGLRLFADDLAPVPRLQEQGGAGEALAVPPAPRNAMIQSEHRFVGSAGCSAVSCHGGRSLPSGEFTHWAKFDTAHLRAYSVLFSDVSVAMAKRLGIAAAHEEARCLACHVAPDVHRPEARGERFAFEHGVGCESCHGPASDWVTAHTRSDWKSWSREQKSAAGFCDLKSLVTRTETCVACHVGSAEATVDHDLIAAGHPRLLFDMAAFHDQLPKHWNERAAVQREPDQELRLWLIGQAASTRALAECVAVRAKKADSQRLARSVPDLAEWDCHACHHDLADESWRGGQLAKPLGTAQWGSWIVPSARVAGRESKRLVERDGAAVVNSLDRLTGLIQPSRFRAVSTADLLTSAEQLHRDSANWLRSLETTHCSAPECSEWLNRLLAKEADADWARNWDGQAQRYLALLAVRQSVRDLSGTEPLARLGASPIPLFQDRLRYPKDFATPQGFRPETVEQLFRELRGEADAR